MPMSEKDAGDTICPLMSGFVSGKNGDVSFYSAACQTSECQWWQWVDPEVGELAGADDINARDMEQMTLPIDQYPDGEGWIASGRGSKDGETVIWWWRPKVIGPRRGVCARARGEQRDKPGA